MTCPSCGRNTLQPSRAFSGRVLWACDDQCASVYSGDTGSSLRLEFVGGRRARVVGRGVQMQVPVVGSMVGSNRGLTVSECS
jgi:ribosomal protein L37AE/L43A